MAILIRDLLVFAFVVWVGAHLFNGSGVPKW